MYRRPLKRLLERFFPARVEKTVTIATTGVLTVTATSYPQKGYLPTHFNFSVDYIPVTPPPPDIPQATVDIDWGDGSPISRISEPTSPPWNYTYIYSTTGTFTVTIKVKEFTGATGTGSAIVEVRTELTVSFVASPESGNIPLTVTFTVTISGGYPPYSWTLDPGDGTSPYSGTQSLSGSFNQLHTYEKVGTYTAKVTVDDALGTTVMGQASIGAGMRILLPRLRGLFPGLFERLDKLRQGRTT